MTTTRKQARSFRERLDLGERPSIHPNLRAILSMDLRDIAELIAHRHYFGNYRGPPVQRLRQMGLMEDNSFTPTARAALYLEKS